MSKYDDTTMVLMKINKGGDYNTKKYFENLFIKEGGKQLIGYTKEEGEKIDEFKNRWNRIKVGDLVVVIEGKDRVYGVVEVTSAPWDESGPKDEDSDWFVHRRRAKLIKYFNPVLKSKFGTSRDTIIEYSGEGARNICDEVWAIIKDDFIKIKETEKMQDLLSVLELKKQIILQGPPGTGKTFTAEKIAEVFTKENTVDNPLHIINQYFIKSNKPSPEELAKRIQFDEVLNEFQREFPINSLQNIAIDKYAFGDGERDSFCYWIEYNLYDLGGYTGQAGKFKIFWKKDINGYSKNGFVKDVQDDQEAMRMIAEQIQKAANEEDLLEVTQKLSNGFILKILHSYHPEKYFPINNEKCINNALKLLGRNYDGLNVFEKNILLQQAFIEKRDEFGADVRNYEFMRFLFGKFDMKGTITSDNKKIITKGEFKLIQFHPAYTYEDFVRGITIRPKGDHQIEYIATDKVLAQFATAAIDNPKSNYVLIIDEINRANLPAVLGELIYALEYRGKSVESMYELNGDNKLILPDNLYIIGTMNTADRSVGHIDYAIRRRFAFESVLPNVEVVHASCRNLFKKVSELFVKDFDQIDWNKPQPQPSDYLASDFSPEDVWIGHSYFMSKQTDNTKAEKELTLKLEYEIKPLLKEYVKDGILRGDITKDGSKDTNDYIQKLSL